MDACGATMGKGSFAMFAVDQASVLEVPQSEANCNTADLKTTAQLMFTGNSERRRIIPAENLLRDGGNQTSTCGR